MLDKQQLENELALVDFDPSKLNDARNITIWEYLTILNTKIKLNREMKFKNERSKHTNKV